MNPDMLEIKGLSCGYGAGGTKEHIVLSNFSLTLEKGDIWCILGRNGVGKTTLFKTMLGVLPPLGGTIKINGRSMEDMSRREIARAIAYVPQYHNPPFAFTVKEIIVMGRNAYIGTFGAPTAGDERIAEEVMEELEISHLANRKYTEISGGERQMVLIARAMAQCPELLMMDEPSANLDYGNQVRMLKMIGELSQRGISIVFTTHDPEHAFLCRAKVAAIIGCRETVTGEAEEIITEELIERMYGIRARIIRPGSGEENTPPGIVPYL